MRHSIPHAISPNEGVVEQIDSYLPDNRLTFGGKSESHGVLPEEKQEGRVPSDFTGLPAKPGYLFNIAPMNYNVYAALVEASKPKP